MLLRLACATAALGLCVATPALDLSPFPDDTRWIAHLDIASLRDGTVGGWLQEAVDDPAIKPKVDLLEAVIGLRPLRDLDAVTIAGDGTGRERAVIQVVGAFDQERLVTLVRASDSYRVDPYGSYEVHRWIDDQGQVSVASFIDDRQLLIAGSADALHDHLDVLAGTAPSLAAGEAFDPAAFEAGTLVLAVARDLQAWGQLGPDAAMLRNIDHFAASARETDGQLMLTVDLTAVNADAGQQVLQLAQGLRAMVLLGGEENVDPAFKAMLQELVIEGNAATVEARLALPLERLKAFLERKRAELVNRG